MTLLIVRNQQKNVPKLAVFRLPVGSTRKSRQNSKDQCLSHRNSDIVNLQVKLGGFMNNPTVKTDLKQTAGNLALDLKQQATDFAQAKIDSTKKAVTATVKDTIASVKKQLLQDAKSEITKKLLGEKDSSGNAADPKKTLEEAGKGLLKGFNPFRKKS